MKRADKITDGKEKKGGAFEWIIYGAMLVLLIGAISAMMSVKVKSRTTDEVLFDNGVYAQAEADYRNRIKQVLIEAGCYNSGITMTRTVSLEGRREYKVSIHNRKLYKMSSCEYWKVLDQIKECKVLAPDSTEYEVEVVVL